MRLAWATAAALEGEGAGEVALADLARVPSLAGTAWYDLGTVRLLRGDPDGAVQPLRRAVQADPERAEAWRNLELALARSRAQATAEPAPAANDARSRARLVEAAARAALVPAPRVAAAPDGAATGEDW